MDEAVSGAGEALRASASFTGGTFVINIGTDSVEVAKEVAKEVCGTVTKLGLGLGALYAGYNLLKPLVDAAVIKALGGKRDDQEVRDIRPGCLHVELHCFTDERFLEVLADYESERTKERLREELSRVGVKVEGLKVKIENMEVVNERKKTITKRYMMRFYTAVLKVSIADSRIQCIPGLIRTNTCSTRSMYKFSAQEKGSH